MVRDPESGRFSVVGVVSFGFGCATKYPGVYARYIQWELKLNAIVEKNTPRCSYPIRVTEVLGWIKQHVGIPCNV